MSLQRVEPTAVASKGPVVLVVDDEPMPRLLTGRTLTAAGFTVHYAENGFEALAKFREVTPDVVLLDVMMPDIDGYEVCQRIRSEPDGKRPAVIMMTGLDDAASIDRAYSVEATDFVVKPINPGLLPHRVRYMHRASRATADVRESERRLLSAERIANIGHWVWSVDDDHIELSNQAAKILGVRERSLPGVAALMSRVPTDERYALRASIHRAAALGQPFAHEHRVVAGDTTRHARQDGVVECSDDGEVIRVVATVRDITQLRRDEEKIRQLAYFDSLTGLANRVLLRQNLDRVLDLAKRHDRKAAVLCLDLDLFKRVNDTLGHSAGDELLVAAAKRLRGVMRRSDSVGLTQAPLEEQPGAVGRVGGDEFSLVLSEIRHAEDAAIVAKRLLNELSKPFSVGREQVFVGASIGIAVFPCDGSDAEVLTKNADAALYHAKAQGRNRFAFYSASLNEATRKRMLIESGLREAIELEQLEVHYQPKVAVRTMRVVGLEALIRWNHPEQGMISPGAFIPVAEDTGLIIPIGSWVLRNACAQLRRWSLLGIDDITVSVNVAARQFMDEDFVSLVDQTLQATGVDASKLELEITESTLMDNTNHSVGVLAALRSLGVRVAIDDFGTGYSSLSYLRKFPIDVLKVDRSFVEDIPDNADNSAIAEAIIAMGDSLRMSVVAEGVETTEQLTFLESCNCDTVQGFLFSRALPADQVAEWLREHQESHA